MCLICDRIEMIKNDMNPFFVKEMETGYVVMGDYQHFYGYTLFLCKKHFTELFHLSPKEKLKFLEELQVSYKRRKTARYIYHSFYWMLNQILYQFF